MILGNADTTGAYTARTGLAHVGGLFTVSRKSESGALPLVVMVKTAFTGNAPEIELLLLCARLDAEPAAIARVKELLAGPVNWNYVIVTAHQHRVMPLIWRTLSRIAPDLVPEEAKNRLQHAYRLNVKRNLFLTSELLQVMDVLVSHDIRTIPYKGPVLASVVYGDIALRQFADLDVIVPVEDVVEARSLLLARGYRPELPMTDDDLVALFKSEKHITLLKDKEGINLEIHWAITTSNDPIHLAPGLLWNDLKSCSIAGRVVETHSREDLLLIQSIHGAKHGWPWLGWVCDVAEIVRSPRNVDWRRPIDNAAQLGALRILLLGVSLAKDLLGAEAPRAVMEMVGSDSAVSRLSYQVQARLFSPTPEPFDLGERERFYMDLREHAVDKLRVARQQLRTNLTLTSRDTDSVRLPTSLMGVLYFLRPIRLAWEYGLAPFKRFVLGFFRG